MQLHLIIFPVIPFRRILRRFFTTQDVKVVLIFIIFAFTTKPVYIDDDNLSLMVSVL